MGDQAMSDTEKRANAGYNALGASGAMSGEPEACGVVVGKTTHWITVCCTKDKGHEGSHASLAPSSPVTHEQGIQEAALALMQEVPGPGTPVLRDARIAVEAYLRVTHPSVEGDPRREAHKTRWSALAFEVASEMEHTEVGRTIMRIMTTIEQETPVVEGDGAREPVTGFTRDANSAAILTAPDELSIRDLPPGDYLVYRDNRAALASQAPAQEKNDA